MNIIKINVIMNSLKKLARLWRNASCIFNDSFNDIHELKCGQAEEKLEAGGDEKLIFNFIWPKASSNNILVSGHHQDAKSMRGGRLLSIIA